MSMWFFPNHFMEITSCNRTKFWLPPEVLPFFPRLSKRNKISAVRISGPPASLVTGGSLQLNHPPRPLGFKHLLRRNGHTTPLLRPRLPVSLSSTRRPPWTTSSRYVPSPRLPVWLLYLRDRLVGRPGSGARARDLGRARRRCPLPRGAWSPCWSRRTW
jgi:hypothetical protein